MVLGLQSVSLNQSEPSKNALVYLLFDYSSPIFAHKDVAYERPDTIFEKFDAN